MTSSSINSSVVVSENITTHINFLLSHETSANFENLQLDWLRKIISQSSNDVWKDSSTEIYNTSFHYTQLLQESCWNIFDPHYLRHSLAWTITLVITYLLILFVGVIGNCMVILVVLLRPQMKSVTNMFIMNLAVADLFVIVFCVPATLLSNIFKPWMLGSIMCKGVAYVQGVSVCASAYSLAAISVDRCLAVYRPFKRPSGLSRTQALTTIGLIWIIALMLTIPWAVIFNVIPNPDGFELCIETWENEYHGKLYFLLANFVMFYCSPMIIISVSNLAIWCHVTNRKVPHDTASAGPIKRMHKKARYGVLKMLGIVTLTFLISWLPLYTIVMRMKFGESISDAELNLLQIFMPFAQWLGSWNSSINPVLYAFLNKKFREMFRSLLPKWFPCVRNQRSSRIITRRAEVRAVAINSTLASTERNAPTSSATACKVRSSATHANSLRFQSHRYGNSVTTKSFLRSNLQGTEIFTSTTLQSKNNVVRCTIVLSENGTISDL